MALTHSILLSTVVGDQRLVVSEATFDDSYPTGGEAIAAADFGLSFITAVFVQSTAAGSLVQWDRANSKLMARDSGADAGDVFPQQADTTDLSALKAHLLVIGK